MKLIYINLVTSTLNVGSEEMSCLTVENDLERIVHSCCPLAIGCLFLCVLCLSGHYECTQFNFLVAILNYYYYMMVTSALGDVSSD